jgi:asparagine synthase (glutamine-hydrolysing)
MCGIAGLVNFGTMTVAEREAVAPMVGTLHHRGPDDSGVFADPFAALGHARLSIIDLATGHQPMCNEDETVWIVFNGEIYNFPELHARLTARGHRFRSHCDTEAIIHLYEEYGDRCVDHLRGMFAFAIWDQGRRRLLLARDRVGIKPLYYWQEGDRLVFGSEIKPILHAPGVPREIDPEALQDYLTYLWVPAPKSIFKGIRKLPAGHTAAFDVHGLRLEEYWDLVFPEPSRETEDRLAERFLEELRQSVRIHLISDVPLGAFLSGGIDSSAVVATMAGVTSTPVVTNSIGFEEENFNELPYADRVAERFRTEHHRHLVRPDAVEVIDRLAWHFDEPFADYSAVPTYYVSRMARENVTVALSGDGGDENMAGYRKYKIHHRERLVRRLVPAPLRRLFFRPLAGLYPKADWLPRVFRAKSTLQNLGSTELEALYRSRAFLDPLAARQLLHPALRATRGGYDSMSVMEDHFRRCPTSDPLHRELYVDVKTYLVDDILTKVDRASMAVSLEVRVPILDHVFMEFMASVPAKLKLRRGEGKYLFKKAFRPILGEDIVDRNKMGFSPPLGEWFRGPLREMAEDTLFRPDSVVREVLDVARVRGMWQEHQRGLRHHGPILWAVLMLECWGQRFLRGGRAPQGAERAPRPGTAVRRAASGLCLN